MPSLRFLALALVTCSSAALGIACGGDDVAAVPDAAGNDATSQDTGTNDTGTNDTGTNDTGTGTDGGTDGSTAANSILCGSVTCGMSKEACCAPKGGSDTCTALPDAGNFQRVCAANESEFRCSSTDNCGGGLSRCCARLPKTSNNDGGPEYTATCNTQGCVTNGQFTALFLCTPNGTYSCGDGGTCKPLVQQDGGPAIPSGYYACQP